MFPWVGSRGGVCGGAALLWSVQSRARVVTACGGSVVWSRRRESGVGGESGAGSWCAVATTGGGRSQRGVHGGAALLWGVQSRARVVAACGGSVVWNRRRARGTGSGCVMATTGGGRRATAGAVSSTGLAGSLPLAGSAPGVVVS